MKNCLKKSISKRQKEHVECGVQFCIAHWSGISEENERLDAHKPKELKKQKQMKSMNKKGCH